MWEMCLLAAEHIDKRMEVHFRVDNYCHSVKILMYFGFFPPKMVEFLMPIEKYCLWWVKAQYRVVGHIQRRWIKSASTYHMFRVPLSATLALPMPPPFPPRIPIEPAKWLFIHVYRIQIHLYSCLWECLRFAPTLIIITIHNFRLWNNGATATCALAADQNTAAWYVPPSYMRLFG